MTRLKQVAVLAAVGVSALLLAPARANAGFLSQFTGNSIMRSEPSRSGTVSFTVFQNTTGNWVTELSALLGVPSTLIGGGAIDTTAMYVYIYQVVNTSTANAKLETFKVFNPGAYTSAGYFMDRVFQDPQGAVKGPSTNPGANYALGTEPPVGGDDVVDGDPSFKNQTLSGFATMTGADATNTIEPSSSDLATGGDGNGFVTFTFPNPDRINKDQWSSIIFLTSNIAPTYWAGRVNNPGSGFGDGDIPVAAPEPGTMLMSVIGIAGLAGSHGWRRWRRRPVAAPA